MANALAEHLFAERAFEYAIVAPFLKNIYAICSIVGAELARTTKRHLDFLRFCRYSYCRHLKNDCALVRETCHYLSNSALWDKYLHEILS